MKKRILALLLTVILCLSLLPAVVFAATGDTVLAFTSDTHNGSENTAANRLDSWIDEVQLDKGGIDYMGFCGDVGDSFAYGDTYWTYVQSVISVVSGKSIEDGYVPGNHEYLNGSFSTTSNAVKNNFTVDAEVKDGDNYRVYCLGSNSDTQSITAAQVTNLSNYLSGIDNSEPVFILNHYPLHSYGGRTTSNAESVINALNTAAGSGLKIIFLWGHNHTLTDPSYDQVFEPGSSIGTKTIQFYYAAAGCMSDSEISYGGSASIAGKGLVVTVSSSDELTFSYYDKNGDAIGGGGSGGDSGGGETGTTYTRVETPEAGKQYVIAAQDGGSYYGLTTVAHTGYTQTSGSTTYSYSGFNGTSVTVAGDKVTSAVSDDMIWKLEAGSGGGFFIKNVQNSKYLDAFYNSSSPNMGGGLTLDDSSEKWEYSSSTDKLKHSTTTKHLTYDSPSDVGGTLQTGGANLITLRTNGDNVYFFEVAIGTGGGGGTDAAVDITSATGDGNTASATIPVGGTLTINLKNGSGNSKTYATTIDDGTLAQITSGASLSIGGSAVGTVTVLGLKAGTAVITSTGTGTGNTYYATINLTVTDSGGSGGGETGTTYTKVATPEAGKQYVIVAQDGSSYYGLTSAPNTGYTNSYNYSYYGFNGTAAAVSNDKVTSAVSDDMIWKLEAGSGANFLIKNVKSGSYLGATYTGNQGGGLTLAGSGEEWSYSVSKLMHSPTTKYLTYESSNDVTGSIKSGSPNLFSVRSSGDNVYFYEVGLVLPNTYTLNVTSPTFTPVQYGYPQPAAQALTITSSGNTDATIASVVSSDISRFTVGGSGAAVPHGGSITTWTVQPAAGLSPGTYSATITVTYDEGATATATVSIVVSKATQSAPTTVNGVNPTTIGGTGSITGAVAAMEYSSNGGSTWTPAPGTVITGLSAGTYQVRFAETATLEASPSVTVTITAFTGAPEATPAAAIDYINEELTGLGASAKYKINGSAVTSGTGGTLAIDAAWLGTTISIVRTGNGSTTTDSAAQSLPVPARPGIPAAARTNETAAGLNDGTITAVTTAMEYRVSGGVWTAVTGTVITGLAPGTYNIRIKATASSFRSLEQTLTIETGATNTYTVAFNSNGGPAPYPSSRTVTYGEYYGTLPTVIRTGYTFAGWFTSASGGTEIIASTRVTTAYNHTLYAHWTANNYTVTFDSNGGSAPYPSSKTVTYGEHYGTLPTVTQTWYTFVGWFTAPVGGDLITAATNVTTDYNHTLYAHWTATVNNYTVTFNSNGGSAPYPSSKTVTYGEYYGNLPMVTRTWYTFVGWFTEPIGGDLITAATIVTTAYNHTLYAHWTAGALVPDVIAFDDVARDAWYYDAVEYVVYNGLFNGVSDRLFAPETPMTRAMLVTVLYRLEGMPTGLAGNTFDDVEPGSWYSDAVSWAVRIGLVNGYGNNSFGPQDPISREQLVTILFRYAQYKAYNVSFGGRTNIRMFEDALKISAYANQAVQWAIAAGIMQGDGAYLIPQGEAARAQVAAMLKRFIEYYSY